MAGIKISALPAIVAPAVGDVFPIVQAGVTYKETLTQLFTLYATTTFPLSLANGGTAAALTASNGGIVYSTGTTLAILAGTATAGQVLLSGSSSAPHWSTLTYPSAAGWTNFTPTLTSAGTVPTFTTTQARYQKVGNVVFIEVLLQNTVGGTAGVGANAISMAAPVACNASSTLAIASCGSYTNNTVSQTLGVQMVGGTSVFSLAKGVSGGATRSTLNCADLNDANSREITFKFFYEI